MRGFDGAYSRPPMMVLAAALLLALARIHALLNHRQALAVGLLHADDLLHRHTHDGEDRDPRPPWNAAEECPDVAVCQDHHMPTLSALAGPSLSPLHAILSPTPLIFQANCPRPFRIRSMAEGPRTPSWFDVRILAPHFTPHVANCLNEADIDYLRTQLDRHHFDRYELPGADMHDEHGFFLTLRKRMGWEETGARWEGLAERIVRGVRAKPARRVAVVVTAADVVLANDFSRMLAFVNVLGDVAAVAQAAEPSVQVCLFLTSHDAGFPSIAPAAQRRAANHPALKVMAGDLSPKEWSRPKDFTLGAMHQFTVPPAAWHFLSCGHHSRGPDEPWHAYEYDDTLTFVTAADCWPCLEGVFARTREGMTLVGIRLETDPERFRIPPSGEDPFTLFRGLCQKLTAWQATPIASGPAVVE